jgi:hypothetical protein
MDEKIFAAAVKAFIPAFIPALVKKPRASTAPGLLFAIR